jgi:hypothetical protein
VLKGIFALPDTKASIFLPVFYGRFGIGNKEDKNV